MTPAEEKARGVRWLREVVLPLLDRHQIGYEVEDDGEAILISWLDTAPPVITRSRPASRPGEPEVTIGK